MARFTLMVGVILVVLGVGAYFGTGRTSFTALIPSVFGVLLAIFGAMAQNPERRKMAMHIAMVVAVLGILGTVGGLVAFVRSLTGGDPAGIAVVSRTLMAMVLIVYLVMGVRTFIAARRG